MINDGYIRLTYTAFLRLRFHTHMTWKDDELRTELVQDGFSVVRAGYCEWTSHPADTVTDQLISLGWAWMEASGCELRLVPGGIQSNVMFILGDERDMGIRATRQWLSHWLDTQPWQQSVTPSLGSLGHAYPMVTHAISGHA